MGKAIVRKAQFGDEEGIHIAHMKSIQDLCSKDYNQDQINAWGGRDFNYEAKKSLIKDHYVWVVECEETIEGYGLLFINSEKNIAEIGGLYFTPKVIGNGLGKEIVSDMKLVASKLGHKSIFLESTITSKCFYEKQGAYQYKDDISLPIGGIPVECHPMKIDL